MPYFVAGLLGAVSTELDRSAKLILGQFILFIGALSGVYIFKPLFEERTVIGYALDSRLKVSMSSGSQGRPWRNRNSQIHSATAT